MCVVHDLGEAINGDIPAIEQGGHPDKGAQEREDLLTLTRTLDAGLRDEILALWDDYENAASPEALAVKALDKLETLLQHNQGANPADFDYAFNLAAEIHGHAVDITLAVGAALPPANDTTMAQLLRNAEIALDAGRAQHRNWLMYQQDMETSQRADLDLLSDMIWTGFTAGFRRAAYDGWDLKALTDALDRQMDLIFAG
eukprot:gene15070-18411_t